MTLRPAPTSGAGPAPANDSELDPRFARLGSTVDAAERRTMGDVVRLAEEMSQLGRALDARLERADGRTGADLAAIRAELQDLERRVAQRLSRLEAGEGEAVRALRAEMSRMVEGLTDRIAQSEAQAAAAFAGLDRRIEDLGAQAQAQAQAGDARMVQALDARLERGRIHTERLIGEIRADVSRHDAALNRIAAGAAGRERLANRLVAALLVLAGGAAAVSLTVVGVQLLAVRSPPPGASAVRLSLPLRPTLPAELPPPSAPPAPVISGAPSPRPPAPPATQGEDYAALGRASAAGDKQALARIQALAQGGAPAAQLLLAKLYETGPAGTPRDLVLAREWTRRAAAGGDRAAMYNLGIFLMTGEGGPPDAPAAARWFEQAAKAGVVDAQFNLALLYENGRGVPKNLVEAYRWYSIAAGAGDGLARGRAIALESKLTRNERAAAADLVGGFQPGRAATQLSVPVIPPATTVAESQKLLAREGRFIGPTNGIDTPAYRAAAAAYLQDHPQARRPTVAP